MKDQKHPLLKRLFGQYIDGEISEREKQIIDAWFDSHNEDQPDDLLNDSATEQRIYQELNGRIRQGMGTQTPVRRLRPAVWLSAASVTIAVIGAAAFFYLRNKPNNQTQQQQQQTWQTITTANREVKKIMLEDGSEVWLNSATTIRVAQFKDDHNRRVYLDRGEAFFKVKHDAGRPFSVATGNLLTRDIGTAFNIRAYNPKTGYRVAVTAGKVDVCEIDKHGNLHKLTDGLTPGQVLQYNPQNWKVNIKQKDTELISAWKTGGPVYMDGLTLTEIGDELARHYNLRVTVSQPELDTTHYTFSLNDQNLGEILQRLTQHTGISYSLDNHQLTINPSDKSMK